MRSGRTDERDSFTRTESAGSPRGRDGKAADRIPATYWWIVDRDGYLGAISLRHRLNEFLLEAGGHIGYGVRPSARRRGVATWALGAVLPHARARGLARVLVTCGDENVASARAIERNGGALDDVRDTALGRTRRYWIDLGQPGASAAISQGPR